jgi:pimeloyl-ACP methyl ester carboxylesterase
MPVVDRGGWELYYETAGRGDEVVVLTHGLASSGATWSAQVATLAASYRVVTWDLRAHGRSGFPPGPCTVAALAADLAAVVRATADGPVHAVGHSAGGVVTMRFGLDHPVLTRSLVLVGTASECNARAHAFYESLAETAAREGGAAVVRRLGTMDETTLPPDGEGFAPMARAMGNLYAEPLTAAIAGVRAPTLIVVGEKDFLGVGGSVIMSRRIPNARLVIVPERGHPIFREDPDGFSRLLVEFLRGVG